MKVFPSTVKMVAEYFSEVSVSTHGRKHGQNPSEWLIYICVILLLPVQSSVRKKMPITNNRTLSYEHTQKLIKN
jgi:hypothetical protein